MNKKKFLADLHIHSCLSPCAELDMTPSAIVKKAIELGINIIAITDHNSMKNNAAALEAALKNPIKNLTILRGMEITTEEEIHILALFDSNNLNIASKTLLNDFNETIYLNLPDIKNDVNRFGYQVIVNSLNEVLEFEQRLLISSIRLNMQEVLDLIHKYNGIAIPCHIDKEQFSIISQLGFIPEGLNIEALEVSRNVRVKEAEVISQRYAKPVVSFSDTHFLTDFGGENHRLTEFYMEAPTFEEIKLTFKNKDGRKIEIKNINN